MNQDRAIVKTIIARTNEEIPVDYSMTTVREKWLVDDVRMAVEGKSEVCLADVTLILLAMLGVQALTDLWLVIRALLMPRLGAADPIRWLDFGKYASKVYWGNLAGFLYFRGNFMILSLSAPIGEVGIYSIARFSLM
jgi:hypothetical protein